MTDENVYSAHYNSFEIVVSSSNYQLLLTGGWSSTTTDGGATLYSDNAPFSTYDADHDSSSENCAVRLGGGFWYKSCAHAQLTGSPSDNFKFYNGTSWISLLKASAEMYCYPGT